MKVHRSDWKYVKSQPDAGFDPQHNAQVVADVIEETEKDRVSRRKQYHEKLQERADALSHFFKSVQMGGRTTNVAQYFGKKQIAYLRGLEVMEQLKGKYAKKKA